MARRRHGDDSYLHDPSRRSPARRSGADPAQYAADGGAGQNHRRGHLGLTGGGGTADRVPAVSKRNSAAGAAGGNDGGRLLSPGTNRHLLAAAGAAVVAGHAASLAANGI